MGMSEQTHKVLVTAVGGNTAQGVVKALRASTIPFTIIGVDADPLSAGFSLVDHYAQLPLASADNYVEQLDLLLEIQRPEAIYVCSPPELLRFSHQKSYLEKKWGLSVFVQPTEVVEIGNDKFKTYQFLKSHGFPHPKTCLLSDKAGLSRLVQEVDFPVILKPRIGSGSLGVFKIINRDQLQQFQAIAETTVVQECIGEDSAEYTATTIAGFDGKIKASIILHRTLHQGTTYRTELFESDEITGSLISIAEALKTVGACNFQFRIQEGKPYIFEINPRFSGTAGIRYLYGFNDPELVFRLLNLKEKITQPKFTRNVVLRYWNEICIKETTFEELRNDRKKHDGFQVNLNPSLGHDC